MGTRIVFGLFLLLSIAGHSANQAIKLKIAGNNYTDETVVRFLSGATEMVDADYDAVKLFSTNIQVPAIYTKVDSGFSLCVNSYPLLTSGIQVNVYIKNRVASTYTLTPFEFGNFDTNVCIYLEEINTGSFYNMRAGASYPILLAVDSVCNEPRFILHITVPSVLNVKGTSCSSSNDGSISVVKAGCKSWNYLLHDSLGNLLKADSNINSNALITNIGAGTYNLIVYKSNICSESFSVVIPTSGDPHSDFIISDDSVYLSSSTISLSNQSANASEIYWDFGDGTADSVLLNPSHTYSDTGKYTIQLIVKRGLCSDITTKDVYVLADIISNPVDTNAIDTTIAINTGIDSYPSKSRLKISILEQGYVVSLNNEFIQANTSLSIYNALGQILFTTKIENSNEEFLIPHQEGLKGVLIFQLSAQTKTYVQKIYSVK